MSLALARKYRPKKFADVAVQTHVSNTLRGAIARNRVAHGYLLCGPRGTGKTTLARVLAMALNCPVRIAASERRQASAAPDDATPNDASEPCGECESCVRIWSGASSLDVVEIDAASNRGVDDARDLRERAMYAPSGEQRWKVYIIDEAHMLTREAWNALLKILEEPPRRVVFVFATTEPQKIAQFAAPVLSRLQRFDLKRIGVADIRARLSTILAAEGVAVDADAVALIARAADGSMRDALSLTDQVLALGEGRLSAADVRTALGLVAEDEYIAILDLIAERRAGDVFGAVARLADEGVDLGVFLAGFGDMIRSGLAIELGGTPGDMSERSRAALEERKGRLASGDLLRMLNALGELEPRFRRSSQQQLLLETMLVRFALLDRTVSLEDFLRDLPAGSRPSSGPSAAGTPPKRNAGGSTGGSGPSPSRSAVVRDAAAAAKLPNESRQVQATPAAPAAEPRRPLSQTGAWPALVVEPADDATPADRAPKGETVVPIFNLNAIAAAWDDVVQSVRRERPLLGTLFEQTIPTAVSGSTLVVRAETVEAHEGLKAKLGDAISTLRGRVVGLEQLKVQWTEPLAAPPATPRMTVEMVRTERQASLRKRDPLLAAAIDALDLELAD